jgi:predicted nucleic acid-binding protein
VVTHRAAPPPSTAQEATAYLAALGSDAAMQVWAPRAGFETRLLQLASDLEVAGARVFDLQIALTAFEHGASEFWTHDHGFTRMPGLRLVDPLTA